jgi:hypothetical protein
MKSSLIIVFYGRLLVLIDRLTGDGGTGDGRTGDRQLPLDVCRGFVPSPTAFCLFDRATGTAELAEQEQRRLSTNTVRAGGAG